jgi:hypothetical protein
MIRHIVDHLRQLHSASVFCGDLLERVYIQHHDLTVTLPYRPCRPNSNDEGTLRLGIYDDSIKFRYLVAFLIRFTPKLYGSNHVLLPLPIDFVFFFSGVFLSGLSSLNLDIVREHSYYQLLYL